MNPTLSIPIDYGNDRVYEVGCGCIMKPDPPTDRDMYCMRTGEKSLRMVVVRRKAGCLVRHQGNGWYYQNGNWMCVYPDRWEQYHVKREIIP